MAAVRTPSRSPKYETLLDLLILKLQSLLDVEDRIQKALPKMAKAASGEKLKEALSAHLEETRAQYGRLERMLESLGAPPRRQRVEAVRGLIEDAEWVVKSVKSPAARDALIVAAAQYIEHYEIAGYGTARAWADAIDRSDVARMLQDTLDEEGAANEKLTALAEGGINRRVESGTDGDA